jgi:hypothetical protein
MVKKNKTFDNTSIPTTSMPQMSSALIIFQQSESDWDTSSDDSDWDSDSSDDSSDDSSSDSSDDSDWDSHSSDSDIFFGFSKRVTFNDTVSMHIIEIEERKGFWIENCFRFKQRCNLVSEAISFIFDDIHRQKMRFIVNMSSQLRILLRNKK